MKIAVQGQIVDTDTIYSISEKVYENNNNYFFDIICFNDHTIEVAIHTNDRNNNEAHDEFYRLLESFGDKNRKDYTEEQNTALDTAHRNVKIVNKNKIEKMRLDIVNIWSSNQSAIPTFDIKKY